MTIFILTPSLGKAFYGVVGQTSVRLLEKAFRPSLRVYRLPPPIHRAMHEGVSPLKERVVRRPVRCRETALDKLVEDGGNVLRVNGSRGKKTPLPPPGTG